MRLTKKIFDSILFTGAFFITSLLIPLIPCRVAPAVPNPSFRWTVCSLNPDLAIQNTAYRHFFGYTSSLTDAYFITLLLVFSLVMLFFHLTIKQKKEKK